MINTVSMLMRLWRNFRTITEEASLCENKADQYEWMK